ncbi:hypothetical protein EXS57_00410 [Candidatus Kaiserbacteria bacterium]|nr:hypothetical protein [Candidatus Kaiserbacteria bacterium]
MTIAEVREKCKSVVARIPRDILVISTLLLVSSLSFGLGYLTGKDVGQGSRVGNSESPLVSTPETLRAVESTSRTGQVVASKNGTKYYPLDCAGIDRISEANKVWFASPAAAVAAGYTLAVSCK